VAAPSAGRPGRAVAGMAAVLVLAALVVAARFWLPAPSGADAAGAPPGPRPGARTVEVVAAPSTSRVTVLGTVAAGKAVPVLAPFDGTVRERRAQPGDRVEAGDVLVVMDPGEMQSRLRDARAGLLKAEMAVRALARWEDSPDVLRARRALQAAEAGLATVTQQLAETKALLSRGVVARNEYDGLVQQRAAQELMVANARQDLAATLERGSDDNRRLAELDHQNAKARLDDLLTQIADTELRAAAAGVLTRPPAGGPGVPLPPAVEPGARVTRGQPLYAIADAAALVVAGKVDEVDINRVHLGQPAWIESDAFPGAPIAGRVVGISAEADSQQGSRAPAFEVRAVFSGDGALRRGVRIGMSARLSIDVASNPQAIVVPIDAVRDAALAPHVVVRDPRSGETRSRDVVLGATRNDGVEVLSGLAVGEIVVLP